MTAQGLGNLRPLRQILAEMQAAEEQGDWDRAYGLRRTLTASRLLDQITDRAAGASELDLRLLERLGVDLHVRDLHEDALRLWEAGRRYAERGSDVYSERTFRTLQVHGLVALLDFEMAASLIRPMVDFDAGPAVQVVEAVVATEARNATSDRPSLAAEILGALGRYWAAVGRLADADIALTWVVERGWDVAEGALDRRQSAVLLGEVRLDQGGIEAFESLQARQREPGTGTKLGRAWSVLEGTALLLSGRLSAGVEVLERVRASPGLPPAGPAFLAAAWPAFHALCFLNRLREAEKVLSDLRDHRAVSAEDHLLAERLLEGRRRAGADLASLPPTAREALDLLQGAPAYPRGVAPIAARTDAPLLARTCERLIVDWARIANGVHLALREGDEGEALRLHEALREWLVSLQSPLLEARHLALDALLAWQVGDAEHAKARAAEARQRFARLGVAREEWAASQLGGWALDNVGTAPRERAAWHERTQALADQVVGRLSPEDRLLHGLNKVSAQDEALKSLVRQTDTPQVSERVVREVVDRMLLLRRWLVRQRVHPMPPEPGHDDGTDVFATAEAQLALGDEARDGPGVAHPRLVDGRLPRDVALLVYAVLPERVAAYVLERNTVRRVSLPEAVSRAELWQVVARVLYDLQQAARWSADRVHLTRLARLLGLEALVGTISPRVRRLYVVPDDVLLHVPFPALPVEGEPLASRLVTTLLPSFHWDSRRAPGNWRKRRGVGVAVPWSRVAPSYRPLKHAQGEIAALEVLRLQRLSMRVGAEASSEEVLSLLGRAHVAHLACHGEFRAAAPHQSGLLLDNGWLTLRDFKGLEFRELDLVVLGCCWGGNMTVLPGGEPVGLPATFLSRGARNVISSLWEVEDDSGARFARDFYTALGSRSAPAALALVQTEWSKTSTPRTWAGYLLYGRGVPSSPWWRP